MILKLFFECDKIIDVERRADMKRIFGLILFFALFLFSLVSCGSQDLLESAEGFILDRETLVLTIGVSNKNEEIDLGERIRVASGATFALYEDEACEIPLKSATKMALKPGENVAYLGIFENGELETTYKVVIRRGEGLKIESDENGVTGTIDMEDLLG